MSTTATRPRWDAQGRELDRSDPMVWDPSSQSVRRGQRAADFKALCETASTPFVATAGSLEYFLTERYCLYTRTVETVHNVLRFTIAVVSAACSC